MVWRYDDQVQAVGAIIDRSRAEIGDDPSTCSQILQYVTSMASRADTLADEVSLRNRVIIAEFSTIVANVAARPNLGHQFIHPLPLPAATLQAPSATPTTAITTPQTGVGENLTQKFTQILLNNGRYLLQVPFNAQTVPTLMRQWDVGLWGLSSVTHMRASSQFAWDTDTPKCSRCATFSEKGKPRLVRHHPQKRDISSNTAPKNEEAWQTVAKKNAWRQKPTKT